MKKTSKKTLILVLVILFLISPLINTFTFATQNAPITAYAATKKVKLNYTTKKLYIGKAFTLKLTGAKVKKWSSSDTSIATVTKKGKVKGKKKGTVTIKCKAKNGKTYKCTVTVRYNVKKECFNMQEWLIEDMWNYGYCDLYHYYESGTDSCGENMDVDYTLHKLKKSYKKLAYYDRFIKSLKGSKYDELKYIWSKLKPEMQRLYKLAFEIDWSKCPKDDEMFSADLYSQYSRDMEVELDRFD